MTVQFSRDHHYFELQSIAYLEVNLSGKSPIRTQITAFSISERVRQAALVPQLPDGNSARSSLRSLMWPVYDWVRIMQLSAVLSPVYFSLQIDMSKLRFEYHLFSMFIYVSENGFCSFKPMAVCESNTVYLLMISWYIIGAMILRTFSSISHTNKLPKPIKCCNLSADNSTNAVLLELGYYSAHIVPIGGILNHLWLFAMVWEINERTECIWLILPQQQYNLRSLIFALQWVPAEC